MEIAEDSISRCDHIVRSDMWTLCVGARKTASADVVADRSTCLKTLTRAFLDIVQSTAAPMPEPTVITSQEFSDLRCSICFYVFYQPVTLLCGHSFCRRCILREPSRMCNKCGFKVSCSRLETNVLIKTLVEKWWPSEALAAKLCEEANQLLLENPESALEKYNAAIRLAPDNAQLLCNRSQALYQLNRLQDSLTDADNAVRLRPHWSKSYYRKAMVLSALSRYEESLIAFGICITLDKNTQLVKPEVTKLLQKLLLPNSIKDLRCSFSYLFNSSDSEENSSGEKDYHQRSKQLPESNLPVRLLLDRIFQEVEKIKRLQIKSEPLILDPQCVEPSDFDCILCCRTLWHPVTTPCGHTYCSMCLDRCLDYSSSCPLCKTSLVDYLVCNQKQVTEFVELALFKALPELYTSRMLSHRQEVTALERAPDIPVFVCTTAFPTIPCPLFVFEPRYRLMVRRCVESGTRQFGMAACVPVDDQPGVNRFAEFGTMLEIKDWVLLGNGCSILSTVGCRRFQVISRGERDGYDTAQVQFLKDTPISSDNLQEVFQLHDSVLKKGQKWFYSLSLTLRTEIFRTFGEMPSPESDWTTLNDGPAWTWWLLAILPLGQQLQVSILRTTCLAKRLRVISKTLDQIGHYLPQNSGLPRQSRIKRRGQVTVHPQRST